MESIFPWVPESGLQLGLLRHGAAAKRDPAKYPDDDLRPLTEKGAKMVRHCAKGMGAIGFAPGLILSSPALRARETADLVRKSHGLPGSSLKVLRALHYESPPRVALERLDRMRLKGQVLLVGHEPWLGNFLSLLLTGRRSRSLPLRKAGLAVAAMEKAAPGQGRLIAFLTPEILESLA